MNNPRLRDLQYLNDNIGKSMWMLRIYKDYNKYLLNPPKYFATCEKRNLKFVDQIKVRDHAHALELFESQQAAFREGDKIEFDELPY